MTKQAIILDTDIGTDIDDVLALIVLVKSTKTKNLAVVTTNGPTLIRSKIAITLLELLNKDTIPVFTGKSDSRSHTAVFVHGKEEKQALTKQLPFSLRNLLSWCQNKTSKSITIIATGPLTTTAWLINQNNIKNKVKKVVWMGSSITEFGVPTNEHNLQTDIASARVVLKSIIPIFIVPLNVTIKHSLILNEIQKFRNAESMIGKFVWIGMRNWLNVTKNFSGVDRIFRSKIFLHDPITVLAGLKSTQVTWLKTTATISKNGVTTIPGNHEVHICTCFPDKLISTIKQKLFDTIQGEI